MHKMDGWRADGRKFIEFSFFRKKRARRWLLTAPSGDCKTVRPEEMCEWDVCAFDQQNPRPYVVSLYELWTRTTPPKSLQISNANSAGMKKKTVPRLVIGYKKGRFCLEHECGFFKTKSQKKW